MIGPGSDKKCLFDDLLLLLLVVNHFNDFLVHKLGEVLCVGNKINHFQWANTQVAEIQKAWLEARLENQLNFTYWLVYRDAFLSKNFGCSLKPPHLRDRHLWTIPLLIQIRVSFKCVLNFRSFLFTCLLTLYSLISWALKSANFGPAADHIACCFLVPAWAIKGAAFLIFCWGKFSSTNYFGHNSCCNWAYFLSWVDFSGTGRCGKGNHARWLRVLLQRYTIKMSNIAKGTTDPGVDCFNQ